MSSSPVTAVLISRPAAEQIFAEVRRWVEHGLREGGSPLESLAYPLSALIPASALLCPVELATLAHVKELVVDGVAIPPDEIKSFSPLNCHFAAEDIDRVTESFNTAIDAQLAEQPRLGVHSKLHAHPFPGGCFLSGGDLHHGVLAADAVRWRQAKGLDTALLHVVYPDAEPRPSDGPWRLFADGAEARGAGGRVRWRIHAWGSTLGGAMVDLGDARIVPASHPTVRSARRPVYWRTRRGAGWCDAQKGSLRAAGYEVSRNVLGRGWRRYLLRAGGRQLLVALPPDLPAAAPRVLEVRSAWSNDFAPLELPWAAAPTSLSTLSLLRLAQHFGRPS